VRHEEPPPVTAADGRAPLVIGLAARRSLRERRPVKVSEVDGP
jgi:myo-inositol 2-dehydrogenase/D-chiro-inositol 1-dehydrogenase